MLWPPPSPMGRGQCLTNGVANSRQFHQRICADFWIFLAGKGESSRPSLTVPNDGAAKTFVRPVRMLQPNSSQVRLQPGGAWFTFCGQN